MAEEALKGDSVKVPAPELPRSRSYRPALRRDQRGQALVEFALVLPLLLMLFLGIVNFGRALDYYNQLTQLVGQGARAAAVNCNPDGTCPATSIQSQLVNSYTGQPELKQGEQVCIMNVPTAIGQPITVKAKFTFSLWPSAIIPIPAPTLTASSTQRAEVVPSTGVGYTANPAGCQ
jgi:TadE-like protein